MDWSNVTAEELVDALREVIVSPYPAASVSLLLCFILVVCWCQVDWKAPRPLGEFLSKFSIPKNENKWTSRLKCNIYYYRTNYLAFLVLAYTAAFFRNPRALIGAALAVLGLLCFNDPFANSFNDQAIRLIRKVHPHTASVLRSLSSAGATSSLATSSRSRSSMRMLAIPRPAFVSGLVLIAVYLWYSSKSWFMWMLATLIGLGLPALHASLRSPNLKARLASAREEFRAVWRGYQADMGQHDYTL